MRTEAIASDCTCWAYDSSLIPQIKFLLCLLLARKWKNLVLLSPCLSQSTLDCWLHIHASLSMRTFIYSLSSRTRWFCPLSNATLLACIINDLFLSNSFLAFPKMFQFHHARFLPQVSTRFKILLSLVLCWEEDHEDSTVSAHLSFDSHISSNL